MATERKSQYKTEKEKHDTTDKNVNNMAVDSEIITFFGFNSFFRQCCSRSGNCHLEFSVRKLICLTCETFENRRLFCIYTYIYINVYMYTKSILESTHTNVNVQLEAKYDRELEN